MDTSSLHMTAELNLAFDYLIVAKAMQCAKSKFQYVWMV